MKAFKAYDIRGVYNRDFNRDDVYKIGFFLPKLLNAEKVLIGRDVRTTSDEIFSALCSGITDAGADAVSIGLATTPMVYYATSRFGYDASVQITASHNPKEYNGLKISRTNSLPVGADSGLKELEEMVNTLEAVPIEVSRRGKVEHIDITGDYLGFLRKYVPKNLTLKLTIDCSNGMANLLIKDLLGDTPKYLFDTLDGTFPNHEPNPLEEENVIPLIQAVRQNKSDLGVIFDGDADRVMFVDENGRFIQPDIITAVLGEYLLKKEQGWVLQDIRTSRSTTEHLEKLGAKVFTWKVGHSFAKMKMRELNAVFGGELAGHYYFRDFYYCDSGILSSLIVLQVAEDLKERGIAFSEYIDSIIAYSVSGELNFRIAEKQEAMDKLKSVFTEKYDAVKIMDFDGYRIEFEDWWFNVRPSNTEPYLRLVVEAKDDLLLEERLGELKAVLSEFQD
ncbi:MAG: phosphomannomutase/phosphoglucomutase [Spirochaetia bacterium]|nr:phosphomannomutase/phosphoglucomutase [Spirochaetia bacterium]